MRRAALTNQSLEAALAGKTARRLAQWRASSLAREIRIEFSNRLTASLGMSYPERGLICLSASLLDDDAPFLDAAHCHELAHFIVYRRHGKSVRPHGPEWQTLMSEAGFQPDRRLAGARPRITRRARRYRHTCPVCHVNQTAGRPMPRWRCARCAAQGLSGMLLIEGMN